MVVPTRAKSMQEYLQFWKKQKPTEEEAARLVEEATEKRSPGPSELKHLTKHNLNLLKAKRFLIHSIIPRGFWIFIFFLRTLDTKQPYKPPVDVEDRVRDITLQTCLHLDPKTQDWKELNFVDDRTIKFKVVYHFTC